MRLVWRKSWPDMSKAEACLIPSGDDSALDVMQRRKQVIVVYDLEERHFGHRLAELRVMERYALPATWKQTIEPEAKLDATKALPDG